MAAAYAITNARNVMGDLIGPGAPDIPGPGDKRHSGTWRGVRANVALSGTYVATGEVPPAALMAALPISKIEAILIPTDAAPAAAFAIPRFNPATGKIQFFILTTGAEVGAAVALTGSLDLIFLGKS